MADRGRFVFDTNVIVSALLFKKSVVRESLDKARTAGIILLSLDVIEELHNVLSRPAFDRYIEEEDRLKFLALLIKEAAIVEIAERLRECRDPKDDKFLELSVNGNASLIVSGDKDLQVLHPFRNIPILSPREFLDTDL
ncbi:MAG: putative toxin-antitoxin system toxin component, PIN family [Anaerolineales bacterium]|nr:putative toxin-antitoxin system toxin component, PIN family [Anaerolineales bacterium]